MSWTLQKLMTREILKLLKNDAKLTTSQISKKTGIPITTVHNRIKKMNDEGIIEKYTLKLNYHKLNRGLEAFIMITVFNITPSGKKIEQEDIAERIKKHESVESVKIITGGFDIMAQVRVASMNELNEFITKFLRKIDGVDKTSTMMVLKEI